MAALPPSVSLLRPRRTNWPAGVIHLNRRHEATDPNEGITVKQQQARLSCLGRR